VLAGRGVNVEELESEVTSAPMSGEALFTARAVLRVPAEHSLAVLRADLDRLMVQGILPDRAAQLRGRDNSQALAGMVGEWEVFKARWAH